MNRAHNFLHLHPDKISATISAQTQPMSFLKHIYSSTNMTKDLEFQLPHSHPLPAMRGTLSFNCLICCGYKTPALVMRPVMQSGFCKEEGSGG